MGTRRLRRAALVVAASTLLVAPAAVAPIASASGAVGRTPAEVHVRNTLGFYPGFGNAAELRSLEDELGVDLAVVVQYGGRRDPADLVGSMIGQLARLSAWIGERDPLYSVTVPLAFGDADARSEAGRAEVVTNLDETASGLHDAAYTTVAGLLVERGLGDAVLRLGHEFDGYWYPWSAQATCDGYVDAFRHVAEVMRDVSPDFRIEWTGSVRHFAGFAECAYPGDDVVDIFGLDVFDQGGPMSAFSRIDGTWTDPDVVWAEQFLPALEFHHALAVSHGKPVSYPEWGLVATADGAYGGDNPAFVHNLAAWLRSLPLEGDGALLYHAYFVGVERFDYRRLEHAAEAFHLEFGAAGHGPAD